MDEFMLRMQELIEHYKSKKHQRKMKEYSYRYHDTNIPCGDEVEVYVVVENDIIKDISYVGKGCVISQSSISLLCDYLKGKNLEEIEKLGEEDIKNILGIELSSTRIKCATLGLRALKKAVHKKYLLAVHKSEKGNIIGIVDKDIQGKIFEDQQRILDLSSPFYKGKEVSFKEVLSALKNCYTANIVGNNIISDLINTEIIKKENVKEIKGIKYVHIYSLD